MKGMPVSLLVPLVFCLTAHPLWGQRVVTISGQVLDSAGVNPVPGVLVVVGSKRVRSDSWGRYQLEDVPVGAHEVLIVAPGCTFSTARMEATADGPRHFVFRVNMPGTREVAPPSNSPGRIITAGEIERMQARSVAEVLRRVAPGMVTASAIPGREARIVSRGANSMMGPLSPIVVVDGIMMEGSNTVGGLEAINPLDIAWIEILPGPAAAWIYGTHGGAGALNIVTKHGGDALPRAVDPERCIATR